MIRITCSVFENFYMLANATDVQRITRCPALHRRDSPCTMVCVLGSTSSEVISIRHRIANKRCSSTSRRRGCRKCRSMPVQRAGLAHKIGVIADAHAILDQGEAAVDIICSLLPVPSIYIKPKRAHDGHRRRQGRHRHTPRVRACIRTSSHRPHRRQRQRHRHTQ